MRNAILQQKQIADLEKLAKNQAAIILELNKKIFGKSSEKSPKNKTKSENTSIKSKNKQLSDNGFNDDAEKPAGTYPQHLPREKVEESNLPEGADINDYDLVGSKETERLALNPAQFYVIATTRLTYKRKSDEFFPPFDTSEHPLGRCSVDMSVVVFAIIQKILFHVPFYRLEKSLELQGVYCNRSNFVRWSNNVATLLRPIRDAILRDIKQSPAVYGDESPAIVNCKQKNKSKSYRTTYFWNLVAPERGIAFHWTSQRNNIEAEKFLTGIKGTFISDALGIYMHATTKLAINWQICWVHIRRNFKKVSSNTELANQALNEINLFLAIDKAIRRRTKDLDDPKNCYRRVRYRVRFLLPLVNRMKEWIEQSLKMPEVQTDDALLKAINYLNSRWEQATCFVTNPYVLPHNNIAEQFFRHLKLGAKNWLFCASDLGAESLAILYSLIYSAKMLGINPSYYLNDVINQISVKGVKANDLIPVNWKKNREHLIVPKYLQK